MFMKLGGDYLNYETLLHASTSARFPFPQDIDENEAMGVTMFKSLVCVIFFFFLVVLHKWNHK